MFNSRNYAYTGVVHAQLSWPECEYSVTKAFLQNDKHLNFEGALKLFKRLKIQNRNKKNKTTTPKPFKSLNNDGDVGRY